MKKNLFITIFILVYINLFSQNTKVIKCDSIYKNKGIIIKLNTFDDEKDGYNGEKNSILTISQKTKNKIKVLVKDSIFSSAQKIEFADFNNDKIKDILVQNISDVRSNWTYNLYLYNPKSNNFKRVIGFEEIKNPTYNAKYDIIESYTVSGEDWILFYGLRKNRVFDYEIRVKDDHRNNFDKNYEKAIKKIRAVQQKSAKN